MQIITSDDKGFIPHAAENGKKNKTSELNLCDNHSPTNKWAS